MVDVEQRLRDLLTDDNLDLRLPAGAVDAVHSGVRRRRRRARCASAAGVMVIAVAVGAVAWPALLDRAPRHSPGTITSRPPDVWITSAMSAMPPALTAPAAMAISGGIVWIAGPAAGAVDTDVLVRVDGATRATTTKSTGIVSDLAATPRHLWVALHDITGNPSRCALQLRKTANGDVVSTFSLPCDASTNAAPIVTANGAHAWVASESGGDTELRLYTAGKPAPTARRTVQGHLAGPHLLAIGGTSVYVVTRNDTGRTVVHQLSATDLSPISTADLGDAEAIAYGSEQVYVAGASGVTAFSPDLASRRVFLSGPVTTLTTGAGLVWCGSAAALTGYDPRTADERSVAAMAAYPGGVVRADGAVLWAVRADPGSGHVVLQSAVPAS